MSLRLINLVICIFFFAHPVQSASIISGPITAKIIRVIDGDTIDVEALIWPDIGVKTQIRLSGVDTPEIDGKCKAEKGLAYKAKKFLIKHIGRSVVLYNIRHGKYAGRMVAKVTLNRIPRTELAEMLIDAGLGRPYSGGKRKGWCS